MTITEQWCNGCEQVLPVSRFHKNRSQSHGYCHLCKECRCVLAVLGYSPERKAWLSMRDRCYNRYHQFFDRYGGRGISVCEAWRQSYEQFVSDIGPRPSDKHTLDRIDNDGDYTPDNCRWATMLTQNRNSHACKLTMDDAREIRRIRDAGADLKTIAALFGVTDRNVSCICLGKTWKEDATDGPSQFLGEMFA